jgi:hypothetical protein
MTEPELVHELWTEPMDKFRFSSSSDIICSVQVRFKFKKQWYEQFKFGSSSGFNWTWTEPRNTIQDEAVREQINYVLDEDEIIGKGSNGTLSMILDGIKKLNKGGNYLW